MRYALIVLLFLTSCSPNFHCRKCLDKGIVKTDTVYRDTTIYTPVSVIETRFKDVPGETKIITQDKLKIVYKRLPGDTVYISGTCESDTVKISVPVLVTNEIKTGYNLWSLIAVGLAAFGVCALLFLLKK